MENKAEDLTYKIKCKSCGMITEMFFGTYPNSSKRDFVKWAHEHSQFPISNQCACDNSSVMFHDLISFTIKAIL